MRTRIFTSVIASAVVLIFPGVAASADTGRTLTASYEFPAIGQGDVAGLCLTQSSVVPGTGSCVEATPMADETHVDITVVDNNGEDVYFTVSQSGRSANGCGTITGFPIAGSGPGGTPAEPVLVFPWAGPGLDPTCIPGSTNLGGGTVTFTFH